MDADFLLPKPTVETVRAECDAFDHDPSTRLGEDALRQLRECFPVNVDPAQVLVKVVTLKISKKSLSQETMYISSILA